MTKPARVHYSGIGVFIDDIDMDRIQTVGSSTRFNNEDFRELGTLNILEIVEDIPDIEVTLDTNEYGSNKTLAALTNKPFGCRVFVKTGDDSASSTTLRLTEGRLMVNNMPVPIAAADIDMAAAASGAGITAPDACVISLKTDPNASTQYTVTFNGAAAENATTPPSAPAGEVVIAEITNVQTDGTVDNSNITDVRTWGSITIEDFETAKFDMYIPVISSSSDTVERTAYMENVYCNRIDLSYVADGTATENYSGEGDNKRWFLGNAKFVISDRLEAIGGETTFDLSQSPTQLLNGKYMLKALKNGKELVEGTDFTVDTGTDQIDFTGDTPAAGDQYLFRYVASAGGDFHVANSDYSSESYEHPGGVKGGHVEIYLKDGGSENLLSRVQSARISAALTRQALRELNHLAPYDRPLELPVEISVSLEFTDSDLEVMARLAGYTYTDGTINTDEINVRDLLGNKGLVIKVYRVDDQKRDELPAGHPWLTPLKTITIDRLIPVSENFEGRVNDNATQTFDFRTFDLTIAA